MADVSHRSRRPSGAPTGGEFAPEARDEADVPLDAPSYPPPVAIRSMRGEWRIDDPSVLVTETDGRVQVRFSMLPSPRNTLNLAVAQAFSVESDVVGAKVAQLCRDNKPMTFLTVDGRGAVSAYEVTGGRYGGEDVLYPKGTRARYFRVSKTPILGVQRGFGGQNDCAQAWHSAKGKFPLTLDAASFDDLPVDDGTDHPKVAAVYLMTHPGFGSGQAPGCMFFATDVTDGEAVNGYFWAPPGSQVSSEHGSFYAKDLKAWGAGRVTNYEPGSITFADCARGKVPDDAAEAYRMVAGLDFYAD